MSTYKQKGSINVFLTLILSLILSLILVTLEGARISSTKIMVSRASSLALDSLLAEFYKPLWEEYHILGLDTGYGKPESQVEEMKGRIEDYISYTLKPGKGFDEKHLKNSLHLYSAHLENLTIKEETFFKDYQSKLFINEASEYMKYKEISSIIEMFLNKLSLLETPKKVSYIYEEKQKVEESVVSIDKGVLKLMCLLDGIKTSGNGLETTKAGELIILESFIKKVCVDQITPETVGINNSTIYQKLRDKYINPTSLFYEMEQSLDEIKLNHTSILNINRQLDFIDYEISALNYKIKELEGIKNKTELIKTQIKLLEKERNECEKTKSKLLKDIENYKKQQQGLYDELHRYRTNLTDLLKPIQEKIDHAIITIDDIMNKALKAKDLIDGYRNILYQAEDEIEKETFQGLEESYKELDKYLHRDSGNQFNDMKSILDKNQLILSEVLIDLELINQAMQNDYIGEARQSVKNAREGISKYQIKGLTLDYSTFVIKNTGEDDPVDQINSLLKNNIMELLLDSSTVSNKAITEDNLPTIGNYNEFDESIFSFDLVSLFKEIKIGETSSGIGGLIGGLDKDGGSFPEWKENMNETMRKVLFNEYLLESFYRYPIQKDNLKERKPTVLGYEKEYLVIGNKEDKDNLSAVISRIIVIRLIVDFISILSDSNRRNEAKLIAAATVGFTGLPILVNITQTILMLTLAFAEALVDTCALLNGISIPLLKDKNSLIMNYPDLFLLNRPYLEQSMKKIENKTPFVMSYDDYLRLFLMLQKESKLALRAMDLIQENIQLRYEDNFYFKNCLFGLQIDTTYRIPTKFLDIPFINRYIKNKGKGYSFNYQTTYSY